MTASRLQCARQRGLAVVLVMWLLVALSLIVSALAGMSRADVNIAAAARDEAVADAVADAGIQLALADFVAEPPARPAELTAGYVFEQHQISVRLSPGEAYLNINYAPVPLLARVLGARGGLEAEAAEALAQRIADWRDPDDATQPLGAERREYEAEGSFFRPRNGPFTSVEDLLQVLGMGYQTYASIRDFVHVHGTSAGLDPLSAPRELLDVLADGAPHVVDALLDARRADQQMADLTLLEQTFLTRAAGRLYRVSAQFELGGRVWQKTCWVSFDRGATREPWKILEARPAYVVMEEGR